MGKYKELLLMLRLTQRIWQFLSMVILYIVNEFRDVSRAQKMQKMVVQKTVISKKVEIVAILLILLCPALVNANNNTAQAEGETWLPDIQVRHFFICYNCNIDWEALNDPHNNSILKACLNGVERSKLEKLNIKDLDERLEKLQTGNLVVRQEQTYRTAFPVVLGPERAQLQRIVEHTAQAILPTANNIMKIIRPHIKGHQEMLYHVMWSIIMDGPAAWYTLEHELKHQLDKQALSLADTTWLIYPAHQYRAGTNSYANQTAKLYVAISVGPNLHVPPTVSRSLMRYKDQLMVSIAQNQPITDANAVRDLTQYGLIDEQGMPRFYIIDANSPTSQEYMTCSINFAREIMKNLQIQEVANLLGTSPEKALVITYHEICYEVLKQLVEAGELKITSVTREPGGSNNRLFPLLSIVRNIDPNALQQIEKNL